MQKTLLLTALLLILKTVPAQKPVSSEEARATAQRIEAATNSGDASVLNHFIFLDSLIERLAQKSKTMQNPEFRRGFTESFAKGFSSYGVRIVASVQMGNYRLIREYESGGARHLLFRMFGNGGLNYHDYTLARVKDSIKASDVLVYSTDELLSTTLAKLADMMDNSAESSPELASAMLQLNEQNNKKNYAGVKEQYDKLDEKFKQNKAIQMVYISACHNLGAQLYEEAIEHFGVLFPTAPSNYLRMIDLYYLRKEYDKGLAAIDKIDKLMGGDKVLDYFRGNFYRLSGKPAESIGCYQRVYQYDPTIGNNVLLLTMVYEETGEKAKAKATLDAFRKTNVFHAADFSDVIAKYPDLK
jgi:tetratricopeptide (TPR) repeat protein